MARGVQTIKQLIIYKGSSHPAICSRVPLLMSRVIVSLQHINAYPTMVVRTSKVKLCLVDLITGIQRIINEMSRKHLWQGTWDQDFVYFS